ncbi:uncharacterized protein CEXT_285901 [Caerostris extrusa]|uniref:Exophilin 5 n=1 Tax=Caerostris extrusa TaxID=172846 RepID=A0AAV4SPK9_CAEEX|nr:uncharacterized protein CEXT_285901 [Caerostris extrusa]
MQLNGLSTLLANHGDISIQESEIMNENFSSVKKSVCSKSISDSVSDHSESLLPQFLNSTFQEKSNILNNENDIQRPINNISSISLVNDKNHYNDPLMNLDYGNNVTNSVLSACNSEELENACKLSKNQDPEDNSLNSVRLTIETTDNVNESACTEKEPNCNSFKTTASLTPIDFNSIGNLKLSEQHNQRDLIPVASSSPQTGSDISQSPFIHYTNNDHSLIQNSQNTYNASAGHNKEHIFTTNVDLTSDKSNCIIDCKIINESNVTDKSVNMGTSTIKVILNLSCIKPENTSNTHTPENHFSSHCGPSVGVPSVTAGQSNYSVSILQHSCYFDEPPILTREVNELYTPPVSEHQMSIEIPLSSSKETAHLNKNTNSTSSCLKNKSLTKNSSNEMNSTNLFSNSVNDTNEWNINPLDLNSSFSLISPFRTKDQVNNILKSLDLPGMENNSRPSTNNKSNDSTFKKSGMCSKIPNKKSQKNNSYRNSINSIYSEESEDDISVSTLSIYSGEETDHSFINTTDDEMPSNILKKRKDNSLKNAKKNLFQSFSSSATFQASTADEETETIEQPTKGSKQQNETLNTSLNHSYNLRSRKSLVKPS